MRVGFSSWKRASRAGPSSCRSGTGPASTYACAPDIAIGPRGEVVVTSNVLPVLWKIDPDTLAVSVHRLQLDADHDKDVGFSGLAYSEHNGAYFAVSELHWVALADRSAAAPRAENRALRAGTRRLLGFDEAPRTHHALQPALPGWQKRLRHAGPTLGLRPGGRLQSGHIRPERSFAMKYRIKQIHCRPWTLSYLSVPLIESHYENNYGGALRRLNAITEQLESLDFATTPGHVLNGLKREELVALNSTLLHELYFASLGGDGQPTKAHVAGAGATTSARSIAGAPSSGRWATRSAAGRAGCCSPTCRATAGSSTSTPPSIRRRSRAASRSSRSTCTSTPITWTSAPTPGPTSIRSCATSTGRRWKPATRMRAKSRRRGRSSSPNSATSPASASRKCGR